MTEKDERLLPLPSANDLPAVPQDYPSSYAPFYDDDSFEEKRSIREYLHVVYKRLPIILALTLFATAVVAFYMFSQPSVFQSNLTMIIEPRRPSPQSKEINVNNYSNDLNYYNTQLQLLRNPALMREVVVRLNLHKEPNLFNGQNKGVFFTLRSIFSSEKDANEDKNALPIINSDAAVSDAPIQANLTPEEKERADTYAGILLGDLDIERRENTNLVDITLKSTNPVLSAAVTNKLAEVFIERDIENETLGAKKTLVDLTDSINKLKETIADQQQNLNNMQRSIPDNPLLGDKSQEFNAAKLQQLSSQLFEAQDTRRKLEAEYNAALKANANGEIFAVQGTNPAVGEARTRLAENKAKLDERKQDLRAKIQAKQAERSNLLARYTESYTPVIQLTKEIEQLQNTLAATDKLYSESLASDEKETKQKFSKEILTGLAAQVSAARNREGQVQASYKGEEASANRQGLAATKLTTLIREIDSNRQLYDTYIQRQKEQELTVTSSRPDNIRVSSEAQTPQSPIGPNRTRNIMIAFLLSLGAGIGLSFLLDYLDDSVKSSDDIGKYLGLPTLALIPFQSNSEKRKLNVISGSGSSSTALVTLEDNRSAMAEAYRHLRTSLLFSSAGKPPQTILVTSSQPAEGKTTTAINTAVTLAQSGAEVVIIDCDLRRPRLHNYFGLENTTGLTNYISGEKNPATLIKTYKDLPNLKIITSGPIPPNPAELLSSNEMKNLLQNLKGSYKHILIDSPPAISFTDAAILSTLVDGVVLVAMSGKSSMHLVRRFKHRLNSLGARIYGVVLNGVKTSSVEYGYYGYANAYNYYANAEDDDSTPLMEEVEAVSSIHETKG